VLKGLLKYIVQGSQFILKEQEKEAFRLRLVEFFKHKYILAKPARAKKGGLKSPPFEMYNQ
jgi:hypothetical protein